MHQKWGLLGAAALGIVWTLVAAPPGHADGSVSGANAASASVTEQSPLGTWPLDPLNETLLRATIQRGKSRRMLFIQAVLNYNGTDGHLIGMMPTVNGIGVEPFDRSVSYCSPTCSSAAGSWWFDIDAAEAAHPGMFVGHPLLVRLIGGEISSTVDSNGVWNASLSVQMTKK